GGARATPTPTGSRLTYRLEITVHLALPEADRWGGRALTRMIELTAERMVQRVLDRFPASIRAAAAGYETSLVPRDGA
ncbi:MAG: DUF3809 family protein, partial [Trueperaceae bacterium]